MSEIWSPVPRPTTGVNRPGPAPRQPGSDLDRDAFLMLLVTQMQNQDPLNPMDDRDFLAQMAQFSALESQQQMTRAMEQHQAYSMIGKNVYAHFFCETLQHWTEADGPVVHVHRVGNSTFLGVLSEVPVFDDYGNMRMDEFGQPMREVRTVDVPVDRVTFVEDPHFDSLILRGIMNNVANARDLGLIGNYVFARIAEDDRNRAYIEGRVDAVNFVNGRTVLVVNGQDVFAEEIISVSNNRSVIGRHIRGAYFDSDNSLRDTDGAIQGISVVNNRMYVALDNGRRFRLNNLNHLLEALSLENRYVQHNERNLNGRVQAITIRGGRVEFYVDGLAAGNRISLEDFRNGGRVLPYAPPTTEEPDDDDTSAEE